MVERRDTARGYSPIEDYAAIGDCHGGALVAKDGDIDWCCLRRFDADPVLCRLLDAGRGGFLAVRPKGQISSSRRYVEDTNVLRTELRCASGTVALVDFMPVGRHPDATLHDYVRLNAAAWLVRRIEVLEGEIDLDLVIAPSTAFAAKPSVLDGGGRLVRVLGGPEIASDLAPRIEGETAVASAHLRAGDRRFVVMGQGAAGVTSEEIDRLLAVTTAFWTEWIGYCRYAGPYAAHVRRSALVLKLLTYAPTGAMAAALTTSLPETLGGGKNWDYRYCWVRDASMSLFALGGLGYSGEAAKFYEFLRKSAGERPGDLRIGYAVDMGRDGDERTLDHLEGYRGSRPVRAGNAAFGQSQTDLYGFILEGALFHRELGGRVTDGDRRRYADLIDHLAGCWDKPDQGIWELRGPPRHFVHSKAMCWVAVDRAIRLLGVRPGWETLRDRILASILQEGAGQDGAHLRQAYDSDAVDGALLIVPMLGLPIDPGLLARTTDAIARQHGRGDLVLRLPDGDGGRAEGAFVACSFWLVDALLVQGRGVEARALFERVLARANDVGLFAEEIDADTGAFLGNFPQALSHIGLVCSAFNLALYEEGGVEAMSGAHVDRARRGVGSTSGWSAALRAVAGDPSMLKLFNSRRSALDLGRHLSSSADQRARHDA